MQAYTGAVLPADSAGTTQLPGEQTVDEALLDEAVVQLNQLYMAKSQELYEVLGDYLVATFFQGRLDLFAAREKHHLTWRALSKRPDLRFGHTTLWYAVAIRQQAQELPDEVLRGLSVTHQRHLTHVQDPEQKLELASRAVVDGLSERDLRQAIQDARPVWASDGPRRGRPPLPRLQKQISLVTKALAGLDDLDGLVGELSAEGLVELLGEVESVLGRLAELQGRMASGG